MRYRKLKEGEMVKKGDQYKGPIGKWYTSGNWSCKYANGKQSPGLTYRRPIEDGKKSIMSQLSQIKRHLLSGRSITSLEALDRFGCMRLGARIYDLKESGMLIRRSMVNKNGKRYASYVANNSKKA